MPSRFEMDPEDLLDYGIDYEDWLNGDTISTSTWTVPDGLDEVDSQIVSNKIAYVWLDVDADASAGDYTLVNKIVTAGGRNLTMRLLINVKTRTINSDLVK